ncbi:Rv3212 family protein [Haloechinothrix halophila]|uniref:Rv3212 family protein n=1 Tax=Haloechinothrix halophila TaxID=1069073 RepID=UPI00041E3E46|nr:PQQ-binding-like beta-propeller repeat protein [Haloechinothrix halophila]
MSSASRNEPPNGGSKPTRRSPWTSTRDRAIAVILTLAVVGAGLLIWLTSDSRATHAETADGAPTPPAAPSEVPDGLEEVWRAPSAATPRPVTDGASVVTGDGGAVIGRDPLTGRERWRYERDRELCTVSDAWSTAMALYARHSAAGNWCSEVTQLDMGTGERTAQRNGNAELGTQLIDDGSHAVTTGKNLLNVWSQNLVRTMEYGEVPAPVEPGRQPRPGCDYGSVAVSSGKIGVIERCDDDATDRLTVFGTTNTVDGETKSDQPKVFFTTLLDSENARVVALVDRHESAESDYLVAVAFGDAKKLAVYDADGNKTAQYALDLPAAALTSDPEGRVEPIARTGSGLYWSTGASTIALDAGDLRPRWTLHGTTGTGTMFAGELVLPVRGGLAVIDEKSGEVERTLFVERGDHDGPTRLATAGPVLLEQRGATLVALR